MTPLGSDCLGHPVARISRKYRPQLLRSEKRDFKDRHLDQKRCEQATLRCEIVVSSYSSTSSSKQKIVTSNRITLYEYEHGTRIVPYHCIVDRVVEYCRYIGSQGSARLFPGLTGNKLFQH